MTDDSRKYWVCCPMCDLDKCVKGSDECEAEIWAKQEKERHMTDKEAIHQLKNAAWLGTNAEREKTEKSVEMAIQALDDNAKLKGNIQWLIDQYQHEVEAIEWDLQTGKGISDNHAYKTGKLGVYAKAVKDLEDLLNADE